MRAVSLRQQANAFALLSERPDFERSVDLALAQASAGAEQDADDLAVYCYLPPVTISCSHEHHAWPGTVSISARTLHAIIADIRQSLQLARISKLVLINGHGSNYVRKPAWMARQWRSTQVAATGHAPGQPRA